MTVAESLLFCAALAAGALFAGVETGLYCLNRIRLRYRAEHGDRRAVRVQHLLRDTSKTIVAILIGNNLAHFVMTAVFTSFLEEKGLTKPEFAATIILAPILFVFSETLPKNIFQQKADTLVYPLEPIITALRCVFYPAVAVLNGLTALVRLAFARAHHHTDTLFTRQGLRFFFQESHGTLTPYLGQITENIMSLHRTTVADSMIPMAQVVAVSIDETGERLKDLIRRSGYSRLPVYEGSPGNIVGILNCYDYLYEDHAHGIRHLVRPALFINRTTPIHTALRRMQSTRDLMAIVTDDRNRPIGIVSIKDLLEEIVGELAEAK